MTKSCLFNDALISIIFNEMIRRTFVDDKFGQVKFVTMELTYDQYNNHSSCCLSSNSGDEQCNAVCG